jgi:hypothetical protein
MSWMACDAPGERSEPDSAVERVIASRPRDLGGFQVRRLLPSAHRQMVGPFIFFDEMGPARFPPGRGIDVRPHPHIGLATVTYLFEGEILHRDSLGSVQPIRPGDVNWMTAGRGIVHSERTGPEVRAAGHLLSGIQAWVALPRDAEETEPAFAHHSRDALPLIEGDGWTLRLIAGDLAGARSPVATAWEILYADVTLRPGGRFAVPGGHAERALYPVSGEMRLDGRRLAEGELVVLRDGTEPVVGSAGGAARLMLLGGAPMDGPRTVWWNFVSSRPERIESAKADWRAGRFPRVAGDDEFIPLPEG